MKRKFTQGEIISLKFRSPGIAGKYCLQNSTIHKTQKSASVSCSFFESTYGVLSSTSITVLLDIYLHIGKLSRGAKPRPQIYTISLKHRKIKYILEMLSTGIIIIQNKIKLQLWGTFLVNCGVVQIMKICRKRYMKVKSIEIKYLFYHIY